MTKLFPDIKKQDKVHEEISMNIIANIMGLVKLGVFAIVYTVVYGLSMYFLGMNEEEKQLVMGPIRKILRK